MTRIIAGLELSQIDKDASTTVADVDDVENECAEAGQIILPLLGVLLQDNGKQ